ncbi:MAG: YigZ family protein [Clostridiales bacterium]|nr:YigZ family protein [Clostridiales bacterium]
MSSGFFTVSGQFENTIVIERSKFICSVKNIENEDDAKAFIESVRKKHSLANHNCYAYIADDKGLVQKFSDDGEPQGTAGLPMLDVLKNKKMFKTVVVVTRYFGGVKLGTGGLVRAYGGSVIECLQKSKIVDMQQAVFMSVDVDYDLYSKLLKMFSVPNVSVINTEFSNFITVDFAVKNDFQKSFIDNLTDVFNGKVSAKISKIDYHAFG